MRPMEELTPPSPPRQPPSSPPPSPVAPASPPVQETRAQFIERKAKLLFTLRSNRHPLLAMLLHALGKDDHWLEHRIGLAEYMLKAAPLTELGARRATRTLMAEYKRQRNAAMIWHPLVSDFLDRCLDEPF